MPTFEEIQQQLKAVNVTDTFGTKKEIKALPGILANDEEIRYLTSGILDGNTWIITCTNKRVIFLDKGLIYGLKQLEIPLEKVNSIGYKTGLVLGTIEVWDGASKMLIKSVTKNTIKPFVDAVNKAKDQINNKSIQTNKPSVDIPEQIKKLAELKDLGILTEDEFANKKNELLAKI